MKKYKTDLIIAFSLSSGNDNAQNDILARYSRKGNNLFYGASISLKQALAADPV